MPFYILLDDSTQALLKLYPLAHIEAPQDPIQLVYLQEGLAPEVRESFFRAKCAVYNLLRTNYRLTPEDGRTFAVEITDTNGNGIATSIRGQSASFICALSLMVSLASAKADELHIAATGVLADPRSGKNRPVDAFDAKIRGALNTLPPETILFYPKEHKPEVTPWHQVQAQKKSLSLVPVTDLQEACIFMENAGILAPLATLTKKRDRKRRMLAALLVTVLVLYLAYVFSASAVARTFLENGHYQIADRCLWISRFLCPWSSQQGVMLQALSEPVELKMLFHTEDQNGTEESVVFTERTRRGVALLGQERWSVELSASRPLYVYLFLKDALDEFHCLVPGPDRTGEDMVIPGYEWRFPQAGHWQNISPVRGREILYLVLARWPCRDLEGEYGWQENRALMERLAARDRLGRGSWVLRLVLEPRSR